MQCRRKHTTRRARRLGAALAMLLVLLPGCAPRREEGGLTYPDGLFPMEGALYVQKGEVLHQWDIDSGRAAATFHLPTDAPLVVWRDALYGSDGHDLLRLTVAAGKLETESIWAGYSGLKLWAQEGPYLLATTQKAGEEAVPMLFTLSTGRVAAIDLPFRMAEPLYFTGLGDGTSVLCNDHGTLYHLDLAAGTCETQQEGWLFTAARLDPWIYMVSAPEQDFYQARFYRYDPDSGQKEMVLENHQFQNAPNRIAAFGDRGLLLVTNRGDGSELGWLAADGTYTLLEESDYRLWDLALTADGAYVFMIQLGEPADFVVKKIPLMD